MNIYASLRTKLFMVLLIAGSIGTYFYINAAQSLMSGFRPVRH